VPRERPAGLLAGRGRAGLEWHMLPRSRRCRWRSTAPAVLLAAACLCVAGAEAQDGPISILLVASPELNDPYFRQSVVLVTRHRGGAPVGVIINRPMPLTLGEAFPDREKLEGRQERIFFGGPVSRHTPVLLYRSQRDLGKSLRVLDDVYMSVAADVLEEILGGDSPPDAFRVFAGFAGWASGQLEREIERGGWYVLAADADIVFRTDSRTLWRELVGGAAPRSRRESI